MAVVRPRHGGVAPLSPKDDSHRTVDTPGWLAQLVAEHVTRTEPVPCGCHGRTYVFRGHGAVNGAARRPGPKLVDVARRAGVSTGTVSAVLNRPATVTDATRVKVALAIARPRVRARRRGRRAGAALAAQRLRDLA